MRNCLFARDRVSSISIYAQAKINVYEAATGNSRARVGLTFNGEPRNSAGATNFPYRPAYLIHDAPDDLHYQVTRGLLSRDIEAPTSFIYIFFTLYYLLYTRTRFP